MYITRLLSFAVGLATLGSLIACNSEDEVQQPAGPDSGEVTLTLETRSTADGSLGYSVYVFETPRGSADYVFKSSLDLTGRQGELELTGGELLAHDYRFLFLAQPAGSDEITVGHADKSALAPGDAWADVTLSRTSAPLSDAIYYKVEDATGSTLLGTHKLEATLDRLIGRMVFDCFKVASAGSLEPIGIEAGFASVLDRVYKIEITYGSPVQQMKFEGTTPTPTPLPTDVAKETQTIIVPEEEGLTVTVPQESIGLLNPSGVNGSVRIEGLNLLPTTSAVPVTLTFHYYDTTPICGQDGEAGHTHTSACYSAKSSLVLNLHGADGTPVTEVRSGYLTVNKAAILFNRIIDLPAGSTINVSFDWDLSNLPNYQ